MQKMTPNEIEQALSAHPQWKQAGDFITRDFQFNDFQEAFAFMTRVAFLAEKHGHHPDLYNVYNRVTLKFSTHDAGGLTEKDFAIATEIDRII
ncbi:MAG: 4a-hydroxytetrahydrobiopterin dehydratase [Lentisphaeria bacterium]|nr:4a-hydroxytetrahydrobiopterin dehydratase [Candidatus Neomarinimicrobiota bacterium]MCF7842837.1 4a-hydroxytetrahydrobiopterin dehydratase [Lentisphaeria bacterium]